MKKLLLGLALLASSLTFASSELSTNDINDKLLLDAACKLDCSLGSHSGEDGSHFMKRDVQYKDFKGMTLEEIEVKEASACNRLAQQAREEGRFNIYRNKEKMTCKFFKH